MTDTNQLVRVNIAFTGLVGMVSTASLQQGIPEHGITLAFGVVILLSMAAIVNNNE